MSMIIIIMIVCKDQITLVLYSELSTVKSLLQQQS